ncbi:hypothetical protein CG710_015495 [Lachnotalea glycerini]|uniref:Peptidase S8/S53 domain-containing protein n=2 Tax=Lachnotalea glycerini TaxID=1763509 RepID=A0A371JC17_9FIRM|nr:hypothetical protein CG710_015495 [Lachnotalea glycerini]
MFSVVHSSDFGISPNANVYILKVLDKDCKGHTEDIIDAINYCINNNIHIINMSFAIPNNN